MTKFMLKFRHNHLCWQSLPLFRPALSQTSTASPFQLRCHSHHSHQHDSRGQSPLPSSSVGLTISPAEIDGARQYCATLLNKYDHPSYLLSTFVPESSRDAYLAIRAFNIDIARVADQVSNVAVGKLRMQFWREAIEKTYRGTPPKEPVAMMLHKVIQDDGRPLSKGFWLKVISAREQYLGNQPFPTIESLEGYSENTYSSLQYLALEAVHQQSITLDHIASHIGKAAGIIATLRGTPLLAQQGANKAAVVLPLDICAEHGLRQEDVLREGSKAENLRDVVFTIATRANDHLITARSMLKQAGEEAKGVAFGTFMPVVALSLYLARLEKVDFDIFHQKLNRREWKLPWKAYFAYRRRAF